MPACSSIGPAPSAIGWKFCACATWRRCARSSTSRIPTRRSWKTPGNRSSRWAAIRRTRICCRDLCRSWSAAAHAADWSRLSNRPRLSRSSNTTGNCWRPGIRPCLSTIRNSPASTKRPAPRRRVERHQRLGQWIARPESTIDSEGEIARLARKLPAGYDPRLAARVQLAMRRVQAYDQLLASLVEPASDVAVAVAWKNLRSSEGQQLVAPQHAAQSICARPLAALTGTVRRTGPATGTRRVRPPTFANLERAVARRLSRRRAVAGPIPGRSRAPHSCDELARHARNGAHRRAPTTTFSRPWLPPTAA